MGGIIDGSWRYSCFLDDTIQHNPRYKKSARGGFVLLHRDCHPGFYHILHLGFIAYLDAPWGSGVIALTELASLTGMASVQGSGKL
jgi:hypothetical protein